MSNEPAGDEKRPVDSRAKCKLFAVPRKIVCKRQLLLTLALIDNVNGSWADISAKETLWKPPL